MVRTTHRSITRESIKIKRIAISAAIVVGGATALYLWVLVPMLILMPDTNALRIRLLYETDHQVLLDACRELSRRVAAGELKPGKYYVRTDPSPQVLTFPQIILDLEPSAVIVDRSGEIVVAMIGGLDHIGVYAYPENYPASASPRLGNRKLLEGLWYYDDGYSERPEDWDEHIEKLRHKVKRP